MSKTAETTRRSFLKSGAIVAAPVAALGVPAAAMAADDGTRAKLALIEDERAIEQLNRAFLRRLNVEGAEETAEFFVDRKAPQLARGLRAVSLDDDADTQPVEMAADGAKALGAFGCKVEIVQELEGQGTFVQMARMQGNVAARHVEKRTLRAQYVKGENGWSIGRLDLV